MPESTKQNPSRDFGENLRHEIVCKKEELLVVTVQQQKKTYYLDDL